MNPSLSPFLSFQVKSQRQPSNTEVLTTATDTKERSHTPGPLPPEAVPRKPELPVSQTASKIVQEGIASSPTSVPVSTASSLPPVVPSASSALPSVPSQLPVPSTEQAAPRPSEVAGLLPGGSNGSGGQGGQAAEERKTKDPLLSKEGSKIQLTNESSAKQLESSSTTSLSNFLSDEAGPSPSTQQDQLPPPAAAALERPPSEAGIAMTLQTGQDKDKPQISGAVQEVVKAEDCHHLGTNGSKKKQPRPKKMKMSLIKITPEDVVKCMLVTATAHQIHFQFSRVFDEPREIFRKLVSVV